MDDRPNPLIITRACAICGEQYQEHAHSVATTIRHLDTKHPDWRDDEETRLGVPQ